MNTFNNVDTTQAFDINSVQTLTTMVRESHKDFNILKDKLNDKFQILSVDVNSYVRVRHLKSGFITSMSSVLFLNSNTYLYDSTSTKMNNALYLAVPLKIKNVATGKRYDVKAGTIFNKYRKDGTRYIVTLNNGEDCYVSVFKVRHIWNTENEAVETLDLGLVESTSSLPVLAPVSSPDSFESVSDTNTSVPSTQAPVSLESDLTAVPKSVQEVPVIEITTQYVVMGVVFSTMAEAQAAVKMATMLSV